MKVSPRKCGGASTMAEVVQQAQQEFWRPPTHRVSEEVSARDANPSMAETCPRCATEFLLGSRFCHSCGAHRPAAMASTTRADAAALAGLWERGMGRVQSALARLSWNQIKVPSWTQHLHFQEIRNWIGLSTASLLAFVIGVACVAGALLVGLLPARTWNDFYSIQFYRAEWLLGATASFVAGILLKKPSQN